MLNADRSTVDSAANEVKMAQYRSKTISMLEELGHFCGFVGQFVRYGLFGPKQGRFSQSCRRSLVQMYEIGNRSVPVVMLIGLFVGMILALQSYSQFKGVGLEDRLGSVINVSIVKELGPVLAAVMLAGRVGGALTAELGTMRVTEQIDALRAMGVEPVKFLVLPRFLACVLLTPLLSIYANIMGVLGGYAIGVGHFSINAEAFWGFSAQAVENWDIFVGLTKGFFFGASIALISCYKGFTCGKGAHGVGQACTEAFVFSLLSILALDFFLAMIYNSLYEAIWGFRSIF